MGVTAQEAALRGEGVVVHSSARAPPAAAEPPVDADPRVAEWVGEVVVPAAPPPPPLEPVESAAAPAPAAPAAPEGTPDPGVVTDTDADAGTPAGVDEDVEAMRRMNRTDVAGVQQTATWRMAFALLLTGFVTAGVGAFSVHWRRRGCKYYKLTVIEGSTPSCCPPGDSGVEWWRQLHARHVLRMIGASQAIFPQGAGLGLPQAEIVPTPAPWAPQAIEESDRCTSIDRWPSGDAKVAHSVTIFFVSVSLLCRVLAAVAFLRRTAQGKGAFPLFVGSSAVALLLAVSGYWLVWGADSQSEAGPAVGMVSGQVLVDAVAFVCTKGSSNPDRRGRKVSKLGHLSDSWKLLPRWLKFVFGLYLLTWLVLLVCFVGPLRRNSTCSGYGSFQDTPVLNRPPYSCPCTVWYLLRLRSDCGHSEGLSEWDKYGDAMQKQLGASCGFLATLSVSAILMLWGTWAVFKRPTYVPGIGLGSSLVFLIGFAVYATAWSKNIGIGTSFTGWAVFGVCHQAAIVPFMLHLFCRFNKQLCSTHYVARRESARDEAAGLPAHEHPITAGVSRSRGFRAVRKVQLFGGRFRREPVGPPVATTEPLTTPQRPSPRHSPRPPAPATQRQLMTPRADVATVQEVNAAAELRQMRGVPSPVGSPVNPIDVAWPRSTSLQEEVDWAAEQSAIRRQ